MTEQEQRVFRDVLWKAGVDVTFLTRENGQEMLCLQDEEHATHMDIFFPLSTQMEQGRDGKKRFEVLTISRQFLIGLGMREEQVMSLTDEDMEYIANVVRTQYRNTFNEQVRFITDVYLIEREWNIG